MKKRLTSILILLAFSLFCGFMGFTVGLGSMFPAFNRVAGPVVCGSRPLEIIRHTYSYRPGQTTYQISAYCVDPETGEKVDRTYLVQAVSGLFYGLVVFALILLIPAGIKLWRKILPRKETQNPPQSTDNNR